MAAVTAQIDLVHIWTTRRTTSLAKVNEIKVKRRDFFPGLHNLIFKIELVDAVSGKHYLHLQSNDQVFMLNVDHEANQLLHSIYEKEKH